LSHKISSIQKILHLPAKSKGENPFWVDKWHASAYYPPPMRSWPVLGFDDELVVRSVDWILKTQNSDGSWGTYIPTAEETAYAMQALWVWNEKGGQSTKIRIQKRSALAHEHLDQPYPPLWIGKCLYNPQPGHPFGSHQRALPGTVITMKAYIESLLNVPTTDPDDARRQAIAQHPVCSGSWSRP
jgi:hypothetical protein